MGFCFRRQVYSEYFSTRETKHNIKYQIHWQVKGVTDRVVFEQRPTLFSPIYAYKNLFVYSFRLKKLPLFCRPVRRNFFDDISFQNLEIFMLFWDNYFHKNQFLPKTKFLINLQKMYNLWSKIRILFVEICQFCLKDFQSLLEQLNFSENLILILMINFSKFA